MIPQHCIRGNAQSRMPRHWLYLDTESRSRQVRGVSLQSWRLGVTHYDGWNEAKNRQRSPDVRRWGDPDEMWTYVTRTAPRRKRIVLVAHNLGYDLRISRAMSILPALGWSLVQYGAHRDTISLVWRHPKGATLVMVDSYSWLPMPLERIGKLLGEYKLPLPIGDDIEQWYARCETDVSILQNACVAMWEHIRLNQLGNWQRTGAGTSWAHWRHCHYTHKVTCHEHSSLQAIEQRSMFAGRTEAWRHGRLDDGPYTEWDMSLAYTHIARDTILPVCYSGHTYKLPEWVLAGERKRTRWLIGAEVVTDVPLLPTTSDTGIIWPVGTFNGYWWDVELSNAVTHGARVTVKDAYHYAAAPALKQWAATMIRNVGNDDGKLSPIVQSMYKHWARTLIGKFASKYSTWETFGTGIDNQISIVPMGDHDTKAIEHLLFLGTTCYIETDEQYGNDAMPSITSSIMAECRVRLWQLMMIAGLEHVVYVDTDSLITDRIGSRALVRASEVRAAYSLRRKRLMQSLTIKGPRQYIVNGDYIWAGVPKGTLSHGNNVVTGEIWESFQGAMAHGRADVVQVRPAKWRLKGADSRRVHLPDGSTLPIRLG